MANRPMHAFFVARFMSSFGDYLVTFAIPLYVYAETQSVSYSGIAFALEWLPRVVTLPFLGMVIDRFPLRRQFLAVDTLRMVLLLVMAAVTSYVTVLALVAFLALFMGYAFIAMERVVATTFGKEEITRNQARLQLIDQTAHIAGPMVAGLMLAFSSFQLVLLLAAALFGLSFLIMLVFFHVPHQAQQQALGLIEDLRRNWTTGFKVILTSRRLIALLLFGMLVNLVEGVVLATMPAVVYDHLRSGPEVFGYINSAAGAASMLMMMLFSFITITRPVFLRWTILALITMVVTGFVMGTTDSVLLYGLSYVLLIAGRGCFALFFRRERLNYIPQEHLGKALGVIVAALLSTAPLAGAEVALLSGLLTPQAIINATCVFSLLAGLLCLRVYR